jgi:hypothetical protein
MHIPLGRVVVTLRGLPITLVGVLVVSVLLATHAPLLPPLNRFA